MTPGLQAARWTTGAAAVLLPLAHAPLIGADGWSPWPVLVALVAGTAIRAAAGAPAVATLALAVLPVWQVISGGGPALYFETIMPWLAFCAAGLLRPTGAWRAGGAAWALTVAAWGLVVAGGGAIVAFRELDFTLYAIGASTLNGASGAAPQQAAALALVAAEAQLVALLLFDWFLGATPASRRRAWLALVPGAALAAASAVWQQAVDPAFLSREPWTRLQRAPGTLFDANAMGALLALTAPILASPALRPRRAAAVVWPIATWTVALAAIVATGSRASLAAALVALAFTVAMTGRLVHWITVAAVAAVLAGIAAQLPGERDTGHGVGRLAGSLATLATDGGQALDRMLWTRSGYGPAARALLAEHPWVGGGAGAFSTLVGDYATVAGFPPLPADNAQNWWFHQLAELGLAGALPLLLASVLAARAGFRALRTPDGTGAAGALLSLALLCLLSPPTQHPLVQAAVGLLVAHAVARGPLSPYRPPRMADVGVWALAAFCAVGTSVEGVRSLRPSLRAVRFHFPYSYGFGPVEPTPLGSGRWTARRAAAAFDATDGDVLVEIAVPHDDAGAAPVRVVVGDRHGPVCTHEARDRTPFTCRVPARSGEWTLVRLEVGRPWTDGSGTRAAVANARFAP